MYAVDQLMAQTRQLAARYRAETGQVLPVSATLAKYDVERTFGFLPPSSPMQAVDCIGQGVWAEKKIQIKSRVRFKTHTRPEKIGSLNIGAAWDTLFVVLYFPTYEVDTIWTVEKAVLTGYLVGSASNRGGERISVAAIERIGNCVFANGAIIN